ncbi:MAG: hypothetical protein KJ630_19200 [Proteobacteria bacterium]|nr:hypothetical protein [Pseudomonadota bacterium]
MKNETETNHKTQPEAGRAKIPVERLVMPKTPIEGKAYKLGDGRKVFIHSASRVGRGYTITFSEFSLYEKIQDFEKYVQSCAMMSYGSFKQLVLAEA